MRSGSSEYGRGTGERLRPLGATQGYRPGIQTRDTDQGYRPGIQTRDTDQGYRPGIQTRDTDQGGQLVGAGREVLLKTTCRQGMLVLSTESLQLRARIGATADQGWTV